MINRISALKMLRALAGCAALSACHTAPPARDPATETATPKALFHIPRVSLVAEYTRVSNIPDNVRLAHPINLPNEMHTLPKSTGGLNIYNFELGGGIYFPAGVELSLDFIYRNSFVKTRDGWSELDLGYHEYLGYRLHGWGMRPGAMVRFLKIEKMAEVYLKAGYVHEWAQLSSGTDAYASYHEQRSVTLPSKLFTGGSVRVCPGMDNYTGKECEMVFEAGSGLTFPLHSYPAEFGFNVNLGLIYRLPVAIF